MAKFTDYTQKTKPADADLLLIHDNAGAANKKTPFSGVWSWILDKLASAVISQLETTNKSIIPAINELNSKSLRISGLYALNKRISSTNVFTFQSSFSSLGVASRQTVYIFGSCNTHPTHGMLTISDIDGACSWSGTGNITASMDATGKVTATLPYEAYDSFILLSAMLLR